MVSSTGFWGSLEISPNALGDENLDYLEPVYKSNLADITQKNVPPFVNIVVGCHPARA